MIIVKIIINMIIIYIIIIIIIVNIITFDNSSAWHHIAIVIMTMLMISMPSNITNDMWHTWPHTDTCILKLYCAYKHTQYL